MVKYSECEGSPKYASILVPFKLMLGITSE